MPSGRPNDIPASEITDSRRYLTRRLIMRGAVLGGTSFATGWLYRRLNYPAAPARPLAKLGGIVTPTTIPTGSGFTTSEALTSLENITHYNNYYEFSTDKQSAAEAARLCDDALESQRRGLVQQTGGIRAGRSGPAFSAGRAHLSDALRRRMVDGHSLGRFFALETA